MKIVVIKKCCFSGVVYLCIDKDFLLFANIFE